MKLFGVFILLSLGFFGLTVGMNIILGIPMPIQDTFKQLLAMTMIDYFSLLTFFIPLFISILFSLIKQPPAKAGGFEHECSRLKVVNKTKVF